MKILPLLTISLFLCTCASAPKLPEPPPATADFPTPPAPDYDLDANWAALPSRADNADRTPAGPFRDRQATAPADVFYIHPTMYREPTATSTLWNADLSDAEINEAVDEKAILNQATVFNAAGRVFAPRYRQAVIRVFYRDGAAYSERALAVAYRDVLAAFDHYLKHENRGRPIIIAAHSQGTTHAKRLLAERFDGKPLGQQLVAAYLVGMAVSEDRYSTIPVCEDPTQTRCFVTWRTYREDYEPPARLGWNADVRNVAVVNPLTWATDEQRAPALLNEGTVLYKFDSEPRPGMVWAERRGAALYTNKPKFFGSALFNTKNYHVADYNFFWVNVRENAVARVEAFGVD